MNLTKKMTAAAVGVLLAASVSAQSPLQCVSPDVVNTFVLLSADGAEIVFGDEKPAELAGHETPPEFEWIGTRTTDRDTRAAFKTSLAADVALDAFLASLTRAGFETRVRGDDPGFRTSAPPLLEVVCRDGQAGVVIVRDTAGARYVTMSFNAQAAPGNCAEILMTPRQRSRGGFAYIPALELPKNVVLSTRAGALPTGTGSGGGNVYRSNLEVEGVSSMAALVDGLDDQLRAQGWRFDARWSGELSAGSTWTLETDGIKLAGKLEVRSIADGAYHQLEFKLLQIG